MGSKLSLSNGIGILIENFIEIFTKTKIIEQKIYHYFFLAILFMHKYIYIIYLWDILTRYGYKI